MPRNHQTLPRRHRRTRPLPGFTIIEESFEPNIKPIPKSAKQLTVGDAQRVSLQRHGGRRVTETTAALVASLAGVGYSTFIASVKRAYQSMAGNQETVPQWPEEGDGIELAWIPAIKSPKTRDGIDRIRRYRRINNNLWIGLAGNSAFSSTFWKKRIREVSPSAYEDEEESEEMSAILKPKRPRSNSFPQTAIECESLSSYTKALDSIGEAWIHALHEEVIAHAENEADIDEKVSESDVKSDTRLIRFAEKLNFNEARMNDKVPTPPADIELDTSEDGSGVDDSSETSNLGVSYSLSSTFEFTSRNSTIQSAFAISRGVGSHIFEILERLRKSGVDRETGGEQINVRPDSRNSNSGIATDNHNRERKNSEAEQTSAWDLFERSGNGRAWDRFELSAGWEPSAASTDECMNSTFTDDEDNEVESGLSSLGTSYQGC